MYGDTRVIRALADGMRDQGSEIRTRADALVGRADAVAWTGVAADAMRRLARAHASELRRCAGDHDAAADALDRHAREVERLEDLIADMERRFGHLVDSVVDSARGALGGLGGLVHSVTSGVSRGLGAVVPGVEDWLDRFTPPPPGNLAWLDVDLPGL